MLFHKVKRNMLPLQIILAKTWGQIPECIENIIIFSCIVSGSIESKCEWIFVWTTFLWCAYNVFWVIFIYLEFSLEDAHLYNGSIRLSQEVSVMLAQAAQVQCVDGYMGADLTSGIGHARRWCQSYHRLFLRPDVVIHRHLLRHMHPPTHTSICTPC